jgi:hypothetical protein
MSDRDFFDDDLDDEALAEQRAVRALLSSLPDPGPVPPDVLDRIHRTLRALQEEDAAHMSAGSAGGADTGADTGATVVPLRRRAAGHRALWLAAAAAVVLSGGGAVVSQLGSDTSARDTAASVAGGSPSPEATSGAGARGVAPAEPGGRVYASGTDYRRADLVRQALALLAPGPRRPAAELPGAAGLLADPTTLIACVRAVGAAPANLLAADLATYEGRPAVVLLLTGGSASTGSSAREVLVADRDCRPGTARRLTSVPVP